MPALTTTQANRAHTFFVLMALGTSVFSGFGQQFFLSVLIIICNVLSMAMLFVRNKKSFIAGFFFAFAIFVLYFMEIIMAIIALPNVYAGIYLAIGFVGAVASGVTSYCVMCDVCDNDVSRIAAIHAHLIRIAATPARPAPMTESSTSASVSTGA